MRELWFLKSRCFLQSEPKEINTRVNKTKEEKELEVQPVRLVDPGKLH